MITAECYRHFAAAPLRNMAIDEWLFARAQDRPGMVALRLYSWQPGAITFGVNQRVERAVRHDLLDGTPLIRRVTGGRALYHDTSELTYAVVVNNEGLESSPLAGSIPQTSEAIARALAVFLDRLGVESQYLRHTVQSDRRVEFFHSAPCFASAARHELMSGSRKVIASAQRRIGSAMLQHGSIKLDGVAYHPALDGPACPSDRRRAFDPLLSQRFDQLWEVFVAVMASELGLRGVACEFSGADEAAVRSAVAAMEKNPAARRDIVKHERRNNSH